MLRVYIISQILILPLFISYISIGKKYNNYQFQWLVHRVLLISTVLIPVLLSVKPVGVSVKEESITSYLVQETETLDSREMLQVSDVEEDVLQQKLSTNSRVIFKVNYLLLISLVMILTSISRDIIFMRKLNKKVFIFNKFGRITVRYFTGKGTAFSKGIIFPTIYLPDNLKKIEEEIILKHEFNHIKNNHLLWLNIEILFRNIFWFNPYYYFLLNRGEELREFLCDEECIKETNYIDYTETLLNNISNNFISERVSAIGLGKESSIKKRVKNILSGVKKMPKGLDRYKSVLLFTFVVVIIGLYPVKILAVEGEVLVSPYQKFIKYCNEYGGVKASLNKDFNMDEVIKSAPGNIDDYPFGSPLEEGRVTLPWGVATDPFSSNTFFHTASDIAFKKGSPVMATGSGEIIVVEYNPNTYGNYIIIKHKDNFYSLYSQLDKTYVKLGQKILVGEKIGLLGSSGRSTGPHLHYSLFYLPNGYPKDGINNNLLKINSINPSFFLPKEFMENITDSGELERALKFKIDTTTKEYSVIRL